LISPLVVWVADAEGDDMMWAQKENWCAGLFGGDLTEGFVSMSLQHITRSRFQITRDLFFLLSFVMRLENTVRLFFPSVP
jgi:hypothetical protein